MKPLRKTMTIRWSPIRLSEPANMKPPPTEFTVFVDDNFHYQDEDERYRLGTYATYEEALEACRNLVCKDLDHFFKPGMSAADLVSQWSGFGEDPFIRSTSEGMEQFSALEYARERAAAMCG